MDRRSGFFLVGSAVVVSLVFVVISAERPLSTLENTLFQVFALGLGLIGSFVLGEASAAAAGRELIEPHARSAFRRLVSLTKSLSRLVQTIATIRESQTQDAQVVVVLDRLQDIVVEQISTAADALEDWRDVLPEEFKALQDSPQPTNTTTGGP